MQASSIVEFCPLRRHHQHLMDLISPWTANNIIASERQLFVRTSYFISRSAYLIPASFGLSFAASESVSKSMRAGKLVAEIWNQKYDAENEGLENEDILIQCFQDRDTEPKSTGD